MLRRLVLLPLLFYTATSVRAQTMQATEKGSVLASGSASIDRTSRDSPAGDTSSTGFFVNPRALYFLAPRLGVGGEFALGRLRSDGLSSTTLGVGPAFRYYLAQPGRKQLPYVGGSVRLTRNSFTSPTGTDQSLTTRDYEGVAGLDFMVSRQVGIAAEAFVSRTEGGGSLFGNATAFGVRFGLDVFFLR
jgi:hypothetical protein